MMKHVTGIIILVLICAGIVLCFFPDKLPDSIRPVSRLVESFHRKVSDWLNPQPKQPEFLYDVIRAVDGDTLLILINGEEISVRLIGIDAPESVHSDISRNTEEGRFASQRMKEYITGKKVSLEYDQELTDRYGRTLAYVYVDGELLEDILLREGLAVTLVMEPNIRYQKHFEEIENQARKSGAGFWGTGFFG